MEYSSILDEQTCKHSFQSRYANFIPSIQMQLFSLKTEHQQILLSPPTTKEGVDAELSEHGSATSKSKDWNYVQHLFFFAKVPTQSSIARIPFQKSWSIIVHTVNWTGLVATHIWYSSIASTNCPQESKSVPFLKLACHFCIVLLISVILKWCSYIIVPSDTGLTFGLGFINYSTRNIPTPVTASYEWPNPSELCTAGDPRPT